MIFAILVAAASFLTHVRAEDCPAVAAVHPVYPVGSYAAWNDCENPRCFRIYDWSYRSLRRLVQKRRAERA